jgi:hypothetical protein
MNNKVHKSYAFIGLAIMIFLLTASNSQAKGFRSLTIYQKVQLNNAILGPGEYRVEILENAGTTEVAIYKGKELVVKSPAQAVRQAKKVERSSVLYLLNGDNVPQMTELKLVGELVSYQFNSNGNESTKKKIDKNT